MHISLSLGGRPASRPRARWLGRRPHWQASKLYDIQKVELTEQMKSHDWIHDLIKLKQTENLKNILTTRMYMTSEHVEYMPTSGPKRSATLLLLGRRRRLMSSGRGIYLPQPPPPPSSSSLLPLSVSALLLQVSDQVPDAAAGPPKNGRTL